jgi:hypothetical protein
MQAISKDKMQNMNATNSYVDNGFTQINQNNFRQTQTKKQQFGVHNSRGLSVASPTIQSNGTQLLPNP